MQVRKFQDFEIWKLSIEITKQIYLITNKSKFQKDFALRDQIRKASISISSNIVEGFERNNNNEFIYFLRIAKGSTGEVRNQLYIAHEIEYIDKLDFDLIENSLIKLAKQISTLIIYLEAKKEKGEFKLNKK
jgi:four helix bundle protein